MKHNEKHYSYTIRLRCIVCGSKDCLESNEDQSYIKCTKCGKEYNGGYDELVSYNEAFIQEVKDDILNTIKDDIKKEVHQRFKEAFKDSNFIKFK